MMDMSEHQDYQYFSCDWEIRPINGAILHEVFRQALDLGCNITAENGRQDDKGFFIITFVIRVPNQIALTKFIENMGNKFGLVDWSEINVKEDYLKDFGMWTTLSRGGFVESSWNLGYFNEEKHK
jgi:hypothetical protein